MENSTKFDLNKNIEIWKAELTKNSKITLDNINELESHLHDEIQELKLLGLSDEESLLVARKRIGNVEDLKAEFLKVNRGFYFKNSLIPYLKGVLFLLAFTFLTELFHTFLILLVSIVGYDENLINSISIGILSLSFIILMIISYTKYKKTSFDLRKLTSIPILVGIIITSKLFHVLSMSFMTRSLNPLNLGNLAINLNAYKLILTLSILLISCNVFYSLKKENKIKTAK
jgi:hypothetical protein